MNECTNLYQKIKKCESCLKRHDCWKGIIYFKNDVIEVDDDQFPLIPIKEQKTACSEQFDQKKALNQWVENVLETRKAGRCYYIHKELPNPFVFNNSTIFFWKFGNDNHKKAFCIKDGFNASVKALEKLKG